MQDDPSERALLPRGACGFHRSTGTYCSRPQEFKVIFFRFHEGEDGRHRIMVCGNHLDRTVGRVAKRYGADKIVIYPRTAPESLDEVGAQPANELLEDEVARS